MTSQAIFQALKKLEAQYLGKQNFFNDKAIKILSKNKASDKRQITHFI